METKIRLKNIQLFGYHGVADAEKKLGQRFEIDVEVRAEIDEAIYRDTFNKTIDYSEIYQDVVKVFSSYKFNLIESLAKGIAVKLCDIYSLSGCCVVIRKPDAPIDGILDTVEVEIDYNA